MVSSRVIRRVHAIVEVPIKEEDDSGPDTAYLSEGARSASGINTPSKSKSATKRKTTTAAATPNGKSQKSSAATKVRRQSVSNGKGKQSATYIETDDESSDGEESSEEGSDYEPERGGGKHRSGPNDDQDDEDDDLLIQSQVSFISLCRIIVYVVMLTGTVIAPESQTLQETQTWWRVQRDVARLDQITKEELIKISKTRLWFVGSISSLYF